MTETEIESLGLEPQTVSEVGLVHEKHGNRLYRITGAAGSLVVKCFADPSSDNELRGYELLESLGVPTLPVHGRSSNAIALEDLQSSPTWRLATEQDGERPEVGTAVAEWYKRLHGASEGLRDSAGDLSFLKLESDALDAENILDTGRRLGVGHLSVWRLAAEHIEALKAAVRSRPQVLNYNDFHWSNLALSRGGGHVEAIVFDYGLLGLGMRYSDYRNVVRSLGELAASALSQAYGPVDDVEAILDEPVAALFNLLEAARRRGLPAWARPSLEKARSGELTLSIQRAVDVF